MAQWQQSIVPEDYLTLMTVLRLPVICTALQWQTEELKAAGHISTNRGTIIICIFILALYILETF